jgi:superfamily I DNA/RNA helicase
VITAPVRDAALTPDQRRIVEWGDGPLVVIAGAGTGKTRVIVERCRYLLDHQEGLLPEQVLVLTYNVKAAQQLQQRLDEAVGRATRARMTVSNFHSFCQRILTESAADAGLPPRPDVLDGVAQVLLLKDIRPNLPRLVKMRSAPVRDGPRVAKAPCRMVALLELSQTGVAPRRKGQYAWS